MNIQEIDKWLDNEYGCSYTRLEELHDYFFEKYTGQKEEIERLKNINKEDIILNRELRKELQQKENIIKEVREYCNNDSNFEIMTDFDTFENHNIIGKDILEILDKGE